MNRLYIAAAIISFVIVLGLAGTSDYQDKVVQQQQYCDNVSAHIWPAYKGRRGCK